MMKIMYAVAVVGAGYVGLTTLLFPKLASQYIFANAIQVDAYLRILGALWIALGFSAALGYFSPLKFSAIHSANLQICLGFVRSNSSALQR